MHTVQLHTNAIASGEGRTYLPTTRKFPKHIYILFKQTILWSRNQRFITKLIFVPMNVSKSDLSKDKPYIYVEIMLVCIVISQQLNYFRGGKLCHFFL